MPIKDYKPTINSPHTHGLSTAQHARTRARAHDEHLRAPPEYRRKPARILGAPREHLRNQHTTSTSEHLLSTVGPTARTLGAPREHLWTHARTHAAKSTSEHLLNTAGPTVRISRSTSRAPLIAAFHLRRWCTQMGCCSPIFSRAGGARGHRRPVLLSTFFPWSDGINQETLAYAPLR